MRGARCPGLVADMRFRGEEQVARIVGTAAVLPSWRIIYLRIASAIAATVAGISLMLGEGKLAIRILISGALLAMAVVAWEASLARLTIEGQGIRIRNAFRRSTVKWTDFDRFVLAPEGGHAAGFVRRTDGSLLLCQVLTPTGLWGGGKNLQPTIDQLNELAGDQRSRQPG
jgi:hypothetical protein